MQKLIKSLKNGYLYVLLVVVFSIAISLLTVFVSDALGDLTSLASEGLLSECLETAVKTLFLYTALIFTQHIIYKRVRTYIQNSSYRQLENKINNKIVSLSYDDERLQNPDDVYTLIQSDCDSVVNFFCGEGQDIIMQTIRLGIVCIYLFMVNKIIFAVYMGISVLSVLIQKFSGNIIEKASTENKDLEIAFVGSVKDVLDNRVVFKTFNAEDYADKMYKGNQERYINSTVKIERIAMPLRGIGMLCGIMPVLSVCIAAAYLVPAGLLSIASFMTGFYLCQTIYLDQMHYVDLIMSASKIQPSVKRINAFINTTDSTSERKGNDDGIDLQNVSYTYPGKDSPALNDVSIHIPYGSKVAFIGENGSGKSTAIKAITGLLTLQNGECRSDDCVLIPQFPFLFTDTIKNNILAGKEFNNEDYQKACSAAMAWDVFSQLPEKDETFLNESGKNLSGGQSQRIALARGFYQCDKTLLLDESISALDPKTASDVIHNVLACPQTVIFILHQKEYLPLMDRIIEFDNGKIIYDGTYEGWRNNNEKQ